MVVIVWKEKKTQREITWQMEISKKRFPFIQQSFATTGSVVSAKISVRAQKLDNEDEGKIVRVSQTTEA